MAKKLKMPMQPVYVDGQGVTRFMENGLVRFLLDWSSSRGMSLNDLALIRFDSEHRAQFAQLIGYSLSGYGELSYVSNESYEEAANAEQELLATKKRAATKGRDAKRAVATVGAQRKKGAR